MVDVLLSRIAHVVFAGLWAGAVCYVAFVVIPLARDGAFSSTEPLETFSGSLKLLSRVSALALLLTGGHLAGTGYTAESLFESTNGQLVLAMTGLWLVLAGLVEVATARFERGLAQKKLREPAHRTRWLFQAAAIVAISLLVVAGALSGNVAQFL
ncbi:CopD family protein [Halovivax gelatinilyticus]|uniref:CopD family protein n=1 Tax=Halovivax gelatinilyticus TaxID=2961597 RepID=UPI0020CA3FC3|nr:CopD family protein [Halovivax gelatinilyticus]